MKHVSGRPLQREDYELWKPEPEVEELTLDSAMNAMRKIGTSHG